MSTIAKRRAELQARADGLALRRPARKHIIEDRSAADRSVALLEQSARELRHAAPTAFGDPSRFGSIAENVIAGIEASRGAPQDKRLERAPAGADITDPTAGGFMVQTNFSQTLISRAYEEALVAGLCDRRPTSKPLADVRIPGIDETSRADGSRFGGVVSYWGDEATQVTKSKPKWKNLNLSTRKLIAFVAGTNELLSDAPMFDAHLNQVVPAELAFKLDLAVLSGSGVGQPLGMLNSPALISVPKETGQAAGSIVRENVNKMWKRLPAPSRYGAVWLANEDADEQLEALSGNPGTYIPAGVYGNEFPLLKGRPVLTIEQCPTLGTVGDLVLADLSKYIIVDGGLNTTLSFHVLFDSDEVSFRFTLRVDGKPGFTSPITPYNGTSTRSPYIALGAR